MSIEDVKRLSTQELMRMLNTEVGQGLTPNEETGKVEYDDLNDYDKEVVKVYIQRMAKKEQRRIDRKKGRLVRRVK